MPDDPLLVPSPAPLPPPAPRPIAGRAVAVLLAAASSLLTAPASAEGKKKPKDAPGGGGVEYAIRWSSAEGGPRSAVAALQRLGLKADGEADDIAVRYFDLPEPAGTPPGFKAILRRRDRGRTAELTFKLRGPAPYPTASSPLATWRCPLPASDAAKDEADVSFLAQGRTRTVHSRSCTSESNDPSFAPPAELRATPKPCPAASMKRWKTKKGEGRTTVEEWKLADGAVLIEVSRKSGGADDFKKQVVDPLIGAGVRPLDRSKSELGSDCR